MSEINYLYQNLKDYKNSKIPIQRTIDFIFDFNNHFENRKLRIEYKNIVKSLIDITRDYLNTDNDDLYEIIDTLEYIDKYDLFLLVDSITQYNAVNYVLKARKCISIMIEVLKIYLSELENIYILNFHREINELLEELTLLDINYELYYYSVIKSFNVINNFKNTSKRYV